MHKLPRVSGDKHIAAFKRAGWKVNHIEGSHYILIKEGSDVHLSIPVHKGKKPWHRTSQEADSQGWPHQ